MTMTIATAAARIGRRLPEAELSLDDALLASTRLMESMLLARRVEGVGIHSGQVAMMRLTRSQRSLLSAENDMIRVHAELLEIGREKAIVDEPGDCPGSTGSLAADDADESNVAVLRAA